MYMIVWLLNVLSLLQLLISLILTRNSRTFIHVSIDYYCVAFYSMFDHFLSKELISSDNHVHMSKFKLQYLFKIDSTVIDSHL